MGASVFPWPGWTVEPMTLQGVATSPAITPGASICAALKHRNRGHQSRQAPSHWVAAGAAPRAGPLSCSPRPPLHTSPGVLAGTRPPSAPATASSPCGQAVLGDAAGAVRRSNAAASVEDREPDATGVVGHDGWLIVLGVDTQAGDSRCHGSAWPSPPARCAVPQIDAPAPAAAGGRGGQCCSLGHCSRGQAHGYRANEQDKLSEHY